MKLTYRKLQNIQKNIPNRIRFNDFFIFDKYDKLKELLELYKESLACYPHTRFEFLIP